MVKLNNEWDNILASEFSQDYYKNLREFLKYEYSHFRVFPPMNDIYNAFRYTPYSSVKAVIIGQDPYHEVGQAHGLCFSVPEGTKIPPSLVNIYKELKSDLEIEPAKHGTLTKWATQGVLLLNTSLTVREGQANSHRGKGWEVFTDDVIKLLNKRSSPIAFILWGRNARDKKMLITNKIHGIFEAAHPSPLSAHNGFFGCRHFSRVNEFLTANGIEPIDWDLSK